MQTKRFIRRKELLVKVGLCATSIYNLERAGQFPMHIMLTPRCAVWDEEAIEAWMDARMVAPAVGASVPDASTRRKAKAAEGEAA